MLASTYIADTSDIIIDINDMTLLLDHGSPLYVLHYIGMMVHCHMQTIWHFKLIGAWGAHP